MAKLVNMIEQLAQEQQQGQEEQFGRLLEEQQQQGKQLMKQQREVEEKMGALQDDLKQTKEAMEGWLQATEESLEGMHRELTKRLEAGQECLRAELQEELWAELRDLRKAEEEWRREPRPGTRPSGLLRPSASPLCIGVGSGGGGGGGEGGAPGARAPLSHLSVPCPLYMSCTTNTYCAPPPPPPPIKKSFLHLCFDSSSYMCGWKRAQSCMVPHSGLLCMMVIHRGTHTSHSSRCWWTLVGGGESDAAGREFKGAASTDLSNLPADRRNDYTVDSPREPFWDSAPQDRCRKILVTP